MKVTVTTAASDRRMAKPADLVALDSNLTTATARTWIDRASQAIAGTKGLSFPPWRQTYTLALDGSGLGWLSTWAKPVASVTTVTNEAGSTLSNWAIAAGVSGIPDRLAHDNGWPSVYGSSLGISGVEWAESEREAWTLTGAVLGWLMPGQVGLWTAASAYVASVASTSYDDASATVYPLGSWVRSYDPRVTLRFECTTAGTSDAAEPVEFLTASADDTITDNTATWTARAAWELPADLEAEAGRLALNLYRARSRDRSIAAGSFSGRSITYWSSDAPQPDPSVIGAYQ